MINDEAIKKIAQALGEINEQTAFVGGAVLHFYVKSLLGIFFVSVYRGFS